MKLVGKGMKLADQGMKLISKGTKKLMDSGLTKNMVLRKELETSMKANQMLSSHSRPSDLNAAMKVCNTEHGY